MTYVCRVPGDNWTHKPTASKKEPLKMNLLEKPNADTTSEKRLRAATEKFLTFTLGPESYAIAVLYGR